MEKLPIQMTDTMKTRLLTLLAALLLSPFAGAQTYDTNSLTNGLVAYYPLNGNLYDYSGNSLDLVYSGTPRSLPLYFDQTFYLKTTNTFPVTGNLSRTISVWVKSSISGGQLLYWGGKDINRHGSELCGATLFSSTNNSVQLCLHGDVPDAISENFQLDPNGWSNLTITYENSIYDTKFYLNSKRINVARFDLDKDGMFITTLNTPATTHLTLGIDTYVPINPTDGWMNPYIGLMKNIRIYNRALSPNEVAALYAMESTPPAPPTTTDTFGSGTNQFGIDFVTIGNPGNSNDTTGYGGYPTPTGSGSTRSHRIRSMRPLGMASRTSLLAGGMDFLTAEICLHHAYLGMRRRPM